jgi:ferritin-like metal-binding protein YciE
MSSTRPNSAFYPAVAACTERMQIASKLPGQQAPESPNFTTWEQRHGDCEEFQTRFFTNSTNHKNMSKLTSMDSLLTQEIKDLYNAETQLVKALPKMAKAATSPELKKGIQTHLEETKVHVERLEQIAKIMDITPRGKTCKAMKGLVEEGAEVIEEEGDDTLRDLALIVAAQKVEHYEIAGYGSARSLAEAAGLDDVAEILQTTLDEEGATDKKLTELSMNLIPTVQGSGVAAK